MVALHLGIGALQSGAIGAESLGGGDSQSFLCFFLGEFSFFLKINLMVCSKIPKQCLGIYLFSFKRNFGS